MGLSKFIIGPLAVLVMASCSALPVGGVAKAVFNPDPEPEIRIPNINRAAIQAADVAAVLIISPSIGIATPAVAIQMRDSLLIYNANDNRGVTMNGGLIYGTLGLGTNLHAVLGQSNDPLINNTLAANWPEQVQRTYQLGGQGRVYDEIAATCSTRMGQNTELEVVGVNRSVVEMVEVCQTSDGEAFNNIHYIDVRSGRMWRTSQWTGPNQENVQVDILEQFDPSS